MFAAARKHDQFTSLKFHVCFYVTLAHEGAPLRHKMEHHGISELAPQTPKGLRRGCALGPGRRHELFSTNCLVPP